MPKTARIPLIGVNNQRGIDGTGEITVGQDQVFLNCTFDGVKNPLTGKATVYVQKRPGFGVSSLVSPGNVSTGLIRTEALGSTLSAFGDTNSVIYDSTINVGTITGRALHFLETLLATSTGYILIRSSDGTAWYYPSDAANNTAYTMDGNNSTTVTDIKIAGGSSTSGLYAGQKLTAGANIVAGTRVLSVNSGAFSAVLDTATTGGAFNDLAVTKEPIAKITDADFVTTGTNISSFTEMDGYVFYVTEDGYLYNSDLNSVTSYSASNKIAVNMSPDMPIAIGRMKNLIVAFGNASTEFFYNAGNPSGSPLSRAEQYYNRIGVQNQRSVVVLENDIFFVGSTRAGDISVRKMTGSQIAPISTPVIERIMGTATGAGAEIYLSAFTMGGYSYVAANIMAATSGADAFFLLENDDSLLLESGDLLILEDSGTGATAALLRLLVYNIELNIWSEWNTNLCTYIVGAGNSSLNAVLASSRANTGGKIYAISPTPDGELHTDDGAAFTMSIRTSKIDMGTNKRKFIKSVRLVCDKQASGTATLTYSDDDYATSVTAGTFDLTSMEPRLSRLGSYVGGRSYTLTHSADTKFRAEALEFIYDTAP